MRYLFFHLITILFLFLTILITAQDNLLWQTTFGGEEYDIGNSIKKTSDGNFIIAGSSQSFVPATMGNIYVIKCDPAGNKIWEKYYGGIDLDVANSVIESKDGNFYIAGYTYNIQNLYQQIYVLKLNANGDTVWTKNYGGIEYELAQEIIETTDSNFVIIGTTDSYGAGNNDIFLIKINEIGDTLWTKTYGTNTYDNGISIKETFDGGLILAGYTASNVIVIKTDSNGIVEWTKTYDQFETATYINLTTDGGYIISGYKGNNSRPYLIRTDENGDTVWTNTYGWYGIARSVLEKPEGGYVFTGQISTQSIANAVLANVDESGNQLWYDIFGGTGNDFGKSMMITPDSLYVIVGGTTSYGNGSVDVYLLKADNMPPDPSIDIYQPNGGESWLQGFPQSILWSSYDVSDVRIELSIDSGFTWNNIVSSTPSDGYFFWDVSSPIDSKNCLIKITNYEDSSVFDISDSVFEIKTFVQTGNLVSLSLGNKWFYGYTFYSYPNYNYDSRFEIEEAIGDTILPGGKPYKKIFITSIGLTDTTTRTEYWGSDSVSFYYDSVYPLKESGLDIFFDNRITHDTSWSDFEVSVYLDGWDTIRTFQKWRRNYSGATYGYKETHTAYGIGPYSMISQITDSIGNNFQISRELIGAIIDGVVYGDTTFYIIGVPSETTQPKRILLSQNYPNPFNPSTTIRYSIPNARNVTIKVFDVLGKEVATLVNEEKSSGEYEVEFNASSLPSGIYFYQLKAGSFVETKKMILLK